MNPRNFFAELKRRNVYKVAVAYAVVAWLLIQAASILFPTFEAPTWVMKVFVAIVLLGFPIALANVTGYIISGQNVQNLPVGAFGYIWLPALAVIAVCSFLVAPLGAKAAHTLPVGKLKRIFASVLYVLAAYMLYKGLAG